MEGALRCKVCKEDYSVERVAKLLICGHTFCHQCIISKLTKEGNIICPNDNVATKTSPDSLIINIFIMDLLKEKQQKKMKIYCSKHKGEKIKYKCNLHSELLCPLCLFEHSEHKKYTEIYTQNEIIEDAEKLLSIVDNSIAKLTVLQGRLREIIDMKVSEGNDIKDILKEAAIYITTPIEKAKPPAKEFPYQMLSRLKTEFLSHEENRFLDGLLPKARSLELIYKATRDGMNASSFHSLCNGISPVLVIVKAKTGSIFGGYSVVPWTTSSAGSVKDESKQSFVFSLSKQTKHMLIGECAIYDHQSYGSSFGNTYAFKIYDDVNRIDHYSSGVGTDFELPPGVIKGSDEDKAYLAGSEKFGISDYEVYRVLNN